MGVTDLIAVLAFAITCFGLGYAIGWNSHNIQK